MDEKKNNPFSPYELQFDAQERKAMVAEMLRELRNTKNYQQKEVAELLGISPQTYNGYETGRNEPPIELLVRVSYLYSIPVDILVQRDRLHKTNESAMNTLAKLEEELAQVREEFKASPQAEVKQLNDLMAMMQKVVDATKTIVGEVDNKPKYR